MRQHKFTLIFFYVILLLPFQLYSQVIENQRLEIPLSEQYIQEFDVFPLDESGALLANLRTNSYGRNTQVQFTKLDTVFRIQWSKLFTPPTLYELKKTYLQKKQALWQVYRKIDSQEILLLRLDLATHDMFFLETKLLTRMDIEYFSVVQNKVLLSGTFNDRPVVELITIFDKNAKILIHDDLLATGGTVKASSELIYKLGGKVAGFTFLIGLDFLNGALQLKNYSEKIITLASYH